MATHGEGVYGNGVGVTTPTDHKMAQIAEFVKTGVNTIRTGPLWDGNATVVTGKANMSLDVRAFSIVTSRSSTLGAVKWANDATLNLTKDVNGTNLSAPGSNSVYWNVFAWHREYSIDGTDSNPVIAVLVGTSAASPTVPALTSYPGAVSLATVLVPAGTTATNSGTTITQTAPFTAAAGGVLPFRTSTERDLGTYLESQLGYLLDSKLPIIYQNGSWAPLGGRRFVVRNTGTPSIGAASWTFYNASGYGTPDLNDGFTFASGELTIPEPGPYRITPYVAWNNPASPLQLQVRANSTTVSDGTLQVQDYSTGDAVLGKGRIRTFAAGDKLRLYLYTQTAQTVLDLSLEVEKVR